MDSILNVWHIYVLNRLNICIYHKPIARIKQDFEACRRGMAGILDDRR